MITLIPKWGKIIFKLYFEIFPCHRCQQLQWCTLSCEFLQKILISPNVILLYRCFAETNSLKKPEVYNSCDTVALTFSYSSKINWYFHHQRVSPPMKKTQWYIIRGQCCPSIWVWQPSADSNVSLSPFLFEYELSGQGGTALCWQTWCTKRPLLSAEGCHTQPDHPAE